MPDGAAESVSQPDDIRTPMPGDEPSRWHTDACWRQTIAAISDDAEPICVCDAFNRWMRVKLKDPSR